MIARRLVPKSSTALLLILLLFVCMERVSAEVTANADYYRIAMADDRGIGAFTVSTGPLHPSGQGLALLSGGDTADAGSSFVSVRSHTTGTDYVQSPNALASGNLVASLDEWATVEAVGEARLRADYALPGPPDTAEALTISTELNATGSTLGDARVVIRTTVTNLDEVPISVGVRYLLDLDIAGDDGPTIVVEGTEFGREQQFLSPSTISATNNDDGRVVFARIEALEASPDLVQYANWPEASDTAFDHEAGDKDIASPTGLNDAALIYYFGADAASALLLEPGESRAVSLTLSAAPPEVCDNGSDDDGDGDIDEEDSDCTSITPAPSDSGATPGGLPNTGGARGEHLSWPLAAALVGAIGVAVSAGAWLIAQRRA